MTSKLVRDDVERVALMAMISVADLLSWVVPDPDKCRAEADELRAQHPKDTPEQLAKRAVERAKKWAAATGGATGAFANPLVMIPAAIADISAMLKIEGIMAGTIAMILDPITVNDAEAFEADVLTVVFPGAISQALRQIGVRAGRRLTKQLVQKYLTEGLAKSAGGFAAKYVALHLTEKAIITKTVPLVGAGIGAGWNWLEISAVGGRAIRYSQRRELGEIRGERFVRVKRLMRALPWRKS